MTRQTLPDREAFRLKSPSKPSAVAQSRAGMIFRLAALWAAAAAVLGLHALVGIPGDYLGLGYPLHPGLKVSLASLAFDSAKATLTIPLVAALARRFRLRWLALPLLVFLWLWSAETLIQPFAIDFGTTWAPTEPLRELFLHPLHTPLALMVLAGVAAWALARPRSS
jgi:hypothetical protein